MTGYDADSGSIQQSEKKSVLLQSLSFVLMPVSLVIISIIAVLAIICIVL